MSNQENELCAVVDSLFANERTSYDTQGGTTVIFKRAGIVQLGQATKFINILLERAPKEKIEEFIRLVAGEQQRLMAEGKSVHDMKLNTTDMLAKMLGEQSLILTVFAAVADQLPSFVEIFSTISAEEYAELSLDEQLVIAAGVLVVNYSFFTQSLPPIIKSVISGLQKKRDDSSNKGKQANPAAKKSLA